MAGISRGRNGNMYPNKDKEPLSNRNIMLNGVNRMESNRGGRYVF